MRWWKRKARVWVARRRRSETPTDRSRLAPRRRRADAMMTPLNTNCPYRRRSIAPTPAVISTPPWASSAPAGTPEGGTERAAQRGGARRRAAARPTPRPAALPAASPRGGTREGTSPAAYRAAGARTRGRPGRPGRPGRGTRPSPCHGIEIPPWRRIPGGTVHAPAKEVPGAAARAPGCPAPIPSAGPISFGAAALPGMGIENTERGRPKTLVPFAPPGSPWLGAPRAPWAARRRASAPAPFSLFAKAFFVFFSGPRRRRRRAPAPPAPRRSRPRRSRRSLFGAWRLSSRPLASASSSARAARRRARPSRGGSRPIFTYRHSESYAPSAYVSSPSSSVFCSSSDHETSYRLVPIFVFVIFFCDAFGGSAPPSSAFASRSTERDAVSRRVFSCVSVVVTDVPSLFPRATEEGGPVGMGSPSRFAPSAWDVLGSVDVSAAPARVILAQPGVQGLGWEGSARSGTRRVRTTRWLRSDRRGLGRGGDEASAGESGAWNHPMAPKKPRRASRVRRGTNGARFAGRQQSCPRPPRSTGRARNAR